MSYSHALEFTIPSRRSQRFVWHYDAVTQLRSVILGGHPDRLAVASVDIDRERVLQGPRTPSYDREMGASVDLNHPVAPGQAIVVTVSNDSAEDAVAMVSLEFR